MTRECPLQCQTRDATAVDLTDLASPFDRVDWAGLPVKLDLAFSQQKCDTVYAQHVMRKQRFQLWRGRQTMAAPCACETTAAPDELASQ